MTLFYSHQDRLADTSGISLLVALARRSIGRAGAVFACIHREILTAKTRRMQHELMLHDSFHYDGPMEPDAWEGNDAPRDAAKFPRAPLILGDKWDF
jgi:hypothetical protein